MQIFVGIFFSPPVSYFSFLFVYNCRRNRWQQQRRQQQRRQQRRHSKSSYGLGLCLPACCDVSSFIYICFILLSWLTGAFAVCARARSLGVGFRPARTPPTGRRTPRPAICQELCPTRLFVITKTQGRALESGVKRLSKRRVGVLWCSLKFVALISIVRCFAVVVVSGSCCCCFWHCCCLPAVFSAFSYPGRVYGVLKVRLQLPRLLLLLLFKCARRI